jgi:hypothetical protein
VLELNCGWLYAGLGRGFLCWVQVFMGRAAVGCPLVIALISTLDRTASTALLFIVW